MGYSLEHQQGTRKATGDLVVREFGMQFEGCGCKLLWIRSSAKCPFAFKRGVSNKVVRKWQKEWKGADYFSFGTCSVTAHPYKEFAHNVANEWKTQDRRIK